MTKIIRVQQPNNFPFSLTWIINNICTNQCSYCPEGLHNGSNHHYDWENAKTFLEILFKKYPNVHCSVAGGEPTVSPFFKDLIKLFHKSGNTIGITTNGARTVRFWEEVSPLLNYICFSYHPEFPDNDFEEKLNAAANHTYVTARIMMLPSKWQECVAIYNQLSKNPFISTEPVRILDWTGLNRTAHQYSESQLLWFEENGFVSIQQTKFSQKIKKLVPISSKFYLDTGEIDESPNMVEYVNKGMTNFYGYRCEVGLKELFVSFDGEVFLGNCGINGSIGNISDPNNIKWPISATICNKLICHCTTDIAINKRLLKNKNDV